jgi:hypothetical protein
LEPDFLDHPAEKEKGEDPQAEKARNIGGVELPLIKANVTPPEQG